MSPTPEEVKTDLAFAKQIARLAGARLLEIQSCGRWEGRTLADVGDQASDGYLQGALLGRFPKDGILSEETKDTDRRLSKHRTWIIDPVDGTREYSQGRDDWAVHVALMYGSSEGIGAVFLPGKDAMLWGIEVEGQRDFGIEGHPQALTGDSTGPDKPRVAASRSHTPDWMQAFNGAMGGELVQQGSVGNKVSLLMLGDADLYVHNGGLKQWDTCAPEMIARAAGWWVSKLDGTPVIYNQADAFLGELVVCRPAMKQRVLDTLASPGVLGT